MTGNYEKTKFAEVKQGKISIYNGKGVEPTLHEWIAGKIQKIDLITEEFNKKKREKIVVTIKGDTLYKLKFDLNSNNGRSFSQQLPNVDHNHVVQITPKYEEKDGFKNSTLFLAQMNAPVRWAFTKKNPNGMPEPKKVEVNGEFVTDRKAQTDFLRKVIQDFSAKLGVTSSSSTPAPISETQDDLPF